MKERGIIMTGVSVRGILDDRKTQTRRIAKPRFDDRTPCEHWKGDGDIMMRHCDHGSEGMPCPLGVDGDRLRVNETFQMHTTGAGIRVTYRADNEDRWIEPPESWQGCPDDNHWRPSIFMPRWASRITLEITEVRTERLQDISEQDAIAEGIEAHDDDGVTYYGPYGQGNCCPIAAYRTLWESINGPGSWEANPWVWVLSFRRIET